MPKKPKKPCSQPGCPELTDRRYCEKHRKEKHKQYNENQRLKSHKFYNTARWQKLRSMQLQREPLCRECKKQGKIVPAKIADHIIPRGKGGEDSLDNLQSLCHACHNRKTFSE